MIITPDAHAKLRDLQTRFRKGELGFHFGKLGGCHGAVPRLRPGQEPNWKPSAANRSLRKKGKVSKKDADKLKGQPVSDRPLPTPSEVPH